MAELEDIRAVRRAIDEELKRPALPPAQFLALQYAALGYTAKAHARHTGKSPRTIEHNRSEAVAALGAKNMTHAVAIALRDSIIRPPLNKESSDGLD